MKVELEGKVAIVTGAGGCIGSAIATALHENGAKVIIADFRNEGSIALEKKLSGSVLIETNVTDEDSVKNLVAATVEKYGRIDILVNNAGINTPVEARRNINEYQNEIWDRIMAVDLHARNGNRAGKGQCSCQLRCSGFHLECRFQGCGKERVAPFPYSDGKAGEAGGGCLACGISVSSRGKLYNRWPFHRRRRMDYRIYEKLVI